MTAAVPRPAVPRETHALRSRRRLIVDQLPSHHRPKLQRAAASLYARASTARSGTVQPTLPHYMSLSPKAWRGPQLLTYSRAGGSPLQFNLCCTPRRPVCAKARIAPFSTAYEEDHLLHIPPSCPSSELLLYVERKPGQWGPVVDFNRELRFVHPG